MHMIKSKTLLLRFLIVTATLSIGIDTTHCTKWHSQRLEDVCTFDEDLAQKGTF